MIYHDFMEPKPIKAPPEWMVKLLEESDAEIATIGPLPLEPFLVRLRESIAQMEATKDAAKAAKAAKNAGKS